MARLGALFGTGRSGTTWLGAILNTHPDVTYRFEPFHRASKQSSLFKLGKKFASGQVDARDVEQLISELSPASPMTYKPPFFPKPEQFQLGQEAFWKLSRAVPLASALFQWCYTPRHIRTLIFKEVTSEKIMAGMLQATNVPIAYLVRSPFGTVASLLRGQKKGKMPVGRFDVLDSLVTNHDASLLDELRAPLKELTSTEKNALLWRLDVEKGMAALRDSKRGLLIVYEHLCDETEGVIRNLCDEMGLSVHERMEEFINNLSGISKADATSADVRDPYFTVFRNPSKQRDMWKQELSAQDVAVINRIVAPSWAFQELQALGYWSV